MMTDELLKENNELKLENEKLKKALEYYSGDIHYEPYSFNCYGCDVTEDSGMIAKIALGLVSGN